MNFYYKKIDELYVKLAKSTSYLNSLKIHLEEKTVPYTLNYLHYPKPMLDDDMDYIEGYNDLISQHQNQILRYSKKYLEQKIANITNQILNLKLLLKDKHSDVDKIFIAIKHRVDENLKDELINNDFKSKSNSTFKYELSANFVKQNLLTPLKITNSRNGMYNFNINNVLKSSKTASSNSEPNNSMKLHNNYINN